jgi:hypothetical protein
MSSEANHDTDANAVSQTTEASKNTKAEVLLIQRMSVKYDGNEDRIALDITNTTGTMARLWLTRHGTDILVRTTSAKVEAYAIAQMARANVYPDQADKIRRSALATQQLTARLTQRSASAVDLPPGTQEHLVTGFAMPPNAQHIQLDFKCRPERNATVLLQTAELFQWLAALQRQYLRAGWGMEVWPAWFTQKGKS